jgi:hypothetical protein
LAIGDTKADGVPALDRAGVVDFAGEVNESVGSDDGLDRNLVRAGAALAGVSISDVSLVLPVGFDSLQVVSVDRGLESAFPAAFTIVLCRVVR